MSARRLAIVVSTGPERGELGAAAAIAGAARAAGIEVGLFFMHAGVAWLREAGAVIDELADDGCDLIACATSAEERGIGAADTEVLLGSQDDHAALIHHADRVVAFT
jgi:predicted peroxiredoxin